MQINTYTNVWASSKRLYTIGDISLPAPVPLASAGIFILALILWAPLLWTLGVPVANGVGLAFYASIPVGLAWIGNKPIFHNKSILQYVIGFTRYLSEPKVWTALQNDKDMRKEKIAISSTVWIPDSSKKRRRKRR